MDIDSGPVGGFDDDNDEYPFSRPPPGEEGFEMSYEGGEFEVFDDLANDIARLQGRYVNPPLFQAIINT